MEYSRQRYADLFNFAPIGYMTLDRGGCIRDINLAGTLLLNRHRRNLIGMPFLMFVAPEDRRKYLRHLSLSRQLSGRVSSELSLSRRDGEPPLYIELISGPARENFSDGAAFLCAVIDCTQRKKAEFAVRRAQGELELRVAERTEELMRSNAALEAEAVKRSRTDRALRESEERLRLILEGVHDYAVFMLGTDGQVVTWNAGAERIKGYRPEEILGRHFSCFYTSEDIREGKPQRLLAAARNTGHVEDEGWRVRKDGSRFWGQATIGALHTTDGRLRGYVKVTRDATERMRAQEALRWSEEMLSDFFERSPIGLLWVKPDGRIQRANQAWLALLGCSRQECRMRSISEFYVNPKSAAQLLRSLRQRRVLQNVRARLRRKDGASRHVLIDADGLWKENRMVHSRWFVRDITTRVDLERQILMVAEREQQRIGQDLHDDLCQQLTGIEFSIQVMARMLSESTPAASIRLREVAQLVRDAISSARNLAHGLALAQLDAEGLPGALRELARRMRKMFQVDCRFSSNIPDARYDYVTSVHLYRIAQEAVSNAVKHGRASRIHIGLRCRNGRLELAVKDNGAGISKRKRKREGMGLCVMQYRAGVIGGTLILQSPLKHGGTNVVCVLNDASAYAQENNRYDDERPTNASRWKPKAHSDH